MFQIKKGVLLVAVVIVVSAFAYYEYAVKILQINKSDDVVPVVVTPLTQEKKVSAVATYMATEDKEDSLRFVVTVDTNGIITNLATLDAKTGQVPEKKVSFNEQVSVMIKGKKLSELTAIDNVAKSSLTTKAFNGVIDELKAQL
ncbi:MAG: hypothetical protein COZ29_02035 [Candidatus Moranbacteria bacterium CG_4_10_14_3_um_filter_45_9]|nr:MAG: hypothetical protein AUK19_03435 [Candidatus Moranbacteria bacterium CG2_30_45_14]PIX90037.1 MAG: hypothetical protein COZ29_02035 [Candidatus Moranbacteria bacterium CG_4_10_14_3_um_filter_45_9]